MKYNIMILDDDEFILASLKRSLHHEKNWQVDCYSNAYRALQQAEIETYHVFLSDYQMPEMDGLEFLASTKKTQPNAIRIILSGDDNLAESASCQRQADIFCFLNKPVEKNALINVIHKALSCYQSNTDNE